MTGLELETLAHLRRAAARAAPPRIRALHLPLSRPRDPLAGAWCALELDDGTLERMRAACPSASRFALVGPSAGMLPDAPFARGVTRLGGVWIHDPVEYLRGMPGGGARGRAARKFALDAAEYPGADALIERM
jgi:hypothetical protein